MKLNVIQFKLTHCIWIEIYQGWFDAQCRIYFKQLRVGQREMLLHSGGNEQKVSHDEQIEVTRQRNGADHSKDSSWVDP